MELDNNNSDSKKEQVNNDEYNIFTLRNITRLSIIIFIGLSVYLFISTIVIIFLTKPNKETTIPNVLGKQFISVYNSIVRKGLRPEIKFLDLTDMENGMILNQYPESGNIVPEGSKLTLTVSRSKTYVAVPNLIGLKLPFAINKMKNLHANNRSLSLNAGNISYIPSDKVLESVVIDHSPSADEVVTPEVKVNLLVSAGKISKDMKMPDVTGQSIDLCFDLLLSKGLYIIEEIVITDQKWKSGIIQSQKPDANDEISKGKTINLKINYFPFEKHPYTSYERITYTIPSDEKPGLFEAYIEDNASNRAVFSRKMKPNMKIDFIFKRKGDADVIITSNKEEIDSISIDADEYD